MSPQEVPKTSHWAFPCLSHRTYWFVNSVYVVFSTSTFIIERLRPVRVHNASLEWRQWEEIAKETTMPLTQKSSGGKSRRNLLQISENWRVGAACCP